MAHLELPASVQLGNHTFKIVRHVRHDEDDDWGWCSYERQQISVATDCPESVQAEVFYHEVIEAINTLYELELPHSQIQTIGAALAQALGLPTCSASSDDQR